MREEVNINDKMYIIITCIVGSIIYLPSIRMNFDLQRLALIGIFYGFLFFKNVTDVLKIVVWPMLGFGMMNFLFALPGDIKMGFLHPIMSLWIWIFPMFMALEMIRRGNSSIIRITFFYNVIIWWVIVSATFTAIEEDPTIMRSLTSMTDEELVVENQHANVGGFFIAYGSGALMLISVGMLLLFKPIGLKRIIIIGIIIISSILVVQAQFTTLLILCSIGLIILIWENTESPITRIISVIGILLLLVSFKYILLYAIDYYKETITSEHILEIYETLYEGQEFENERNRFLTDAIELFFTSPIWGHDILHNVDFATISRHCHSTFFLNATRTGLIGVYFFYATLWKSFKPIYQEYSNVSKRLFRVPIIYTFALSVLNPIEGDTFSYTVGFFIPIFVNYIYESRKSESIEALA